MRLTKASNDKYVHCNIDDECNGMCGSCKRNTEIRKKLKEYEDAEEKGKLLKLQVVLGQKVYVLAECKNIPTVLDGGYYDATGYYCPYEDKCQHDCDSCEEVENKTAVFEDTVRCISYDETGITLYTDKTCVCGELGENIFLDKENAYKELADREAQHE